jgi:DNA-binding PadR family transcriptional regulator
MAETMPPRLGRVLLGLLHATPMSGYQIRKLFATTPMEAFSDSPGSIYPALRRLEREGLVSGWTEPAHSRRPRRVFALTEAGRDTLRRWLEEPVTLEEVKHRSDDLILRFAFMPANIAPHGAQTAHKPH